MARELTGALLSFAAALGLTIIAEAPVAWLLGQRTLRSQACLALVNVVTNPTLNLLINLLAYLRIHTVGSPLDPLLIALEGAVIAAEALLLRAALGLPAGRAAALSVAANAASWLAGALLLWD